MVTEDEIREKIAAAKAAATAARLEREEMRWTSPVGAGEREERITAALASLKAAMAPIRSYLGRLAWAKPGEEAITALETDLREASEGLQYERKQLTKMRRIR